jgi:hypothetical protein
VGERRAVDTPSGKAEMGRGRIRGWAASVPPTFFLFFLFLFFFFFCFLFSFLSFAIFDSNQIKQGPKLL